MNILITGAQFGNKGAQSMLFTTISEVRNRYPEAEFYYLPIDYFKESCFNNVNDYRFHFVVDDKAGRDFPAKFGPINHILRWARIQRILFNANKHGDVLELSKIWDRMDVLIDISGYSLTSRFGISSINRVLRLINTAKAHGMKVILLPQSYGPFDFSDDVCGKIGMALSNVDLLFAREKDGINQLKECCGVTNAVLSTDIVLQSKEIDWKNVFVCKPKLKYPVLATSNNVGIIPNGETLRNGAHDNVVNLYREIIKKLRKGGKEIYIFCHADDFSLCQEIYEMVKNDTHCHLIEDEIDSLSYCQFVRQFDFIVASRFHSIVHSYREGVPAIILGWAIKYQTLAASLEQQQYVFDVTNNEQLNKRMLSIRLDKMLFSYTDETEVIIRNLDRVTKNSCFDQCNKILDSIS